MPLNKVLPIFIALILSFSTGLAKADKIENQTVSNEPDGMLALPQALALALTQNPELSAFSWESRAQEAALVQAAFFPNPTFNANAANFGNKSIQGFDGDVITLELSQLIELGDKRAARMNVAAINKELADWDYETKRLDILTQVSQHFIEVLLAQQTLDLTRHTKDLVNQILQATTTRVQAGKVPPIEETKAKIIASSVQIELMRSEREFEATRKRLAANWGSTNPRFNTVIGNLEAIEDLPPIETLQQRLTRHPELARWNSEINQRRALITAEQSKAVPDVTITFGASKYLMPNQYAATVGFSVPLPVFDHNQGAIEQAQHRLSKALDEQRSSQIRIETALSNAYERLAAIRFEVITLRQDILPHAQSAYDTTQEGYRFGKFGFIEVLDAQRTLFSAKKQALISLADYHKAKIDIERLINAGISSTDAPTHTETFK